MNFGLVPDDSPLNYDEWRALLGLPEVSEEVKIRARFRHLSEQLTRQVVPAWKRLCLELAPAMQQFTIAVNRISTAHLGGKAPSPPRGYGTVMAVSDEATSQKQRALPRPATTPPMWAQDPTKTRRQR